jgi:hypothetical protein
MNGSRVAWAAWALVPVAAAAYHFGPGQRDYARDRATKAHEAAAQALAQAEAAQAIAYAKHLDALDARNAAVNSPSGESGKRAAALTAEEDALYASAAALWGTAAEGYQNVIAELGATDEVATRNMRWVASYATVRSGDVWTGIAELEALLEDPAVSPELALATREELATAYYYGARLLRLSGMPQQEWRIESSKARQHFRYLAERDGTSSPDSQRNLELVLNLEQAAQSDLVGAPLPKSCPNTGKTGKRKCGTCGKRPAPPRTKADARGAGGAEEIRDGW